MTLLLLLISPMAVFIFLIFAPNVHDVKAQAGCGTEMGPPSPGTICPDGSVPLKDPNLPLGCPGSAQQGPRAPGEIACPSRPGRPACQLEGNVCRDSKGNDVSGGVRDDQGGGTAHSSPGYTVNDCSSDGELTKDNCGIVGYLVMFINILSALAGIVITGSIAYGGIQYSMAGSDPQKVSEAKGRIRNAIIALLLFIFGYSLLDFLVPGGLFR